MKASIVRALCASIVVSTGLASAQSLSYNAQDLDHDSIIDPGNIGYQSSIAYIDDFALMYNPGSKQLDFSATFSKNSASPDGFWFVVSDGPDPKKNSNEYTISTSTLRRFPVPDRRSLPPTFTTVSMARMLGRIPANFWNHPRPGPVSSLPPLRRATKQHLRFPQT